MWKVFIVNYPREKCRLRGFITYLRVVKITHWTQEITGKSWIGVLGSQMDSCYSFKYLPPTIAGCPYPEQWEHVQTQKMWKYNKQSELHVIFESKDHFENRAHSNVKDKDCTFHHQETQSTDRCVNGCSTAFLNLGEVVIKNPFWE